MRLQRVTIQDVADACGLSRNTVSKVFNSRGAVQEPTRLLVMRTAQELGYFHQIPEEAALPAQPTQSIALLTCRIPTDHHFGTLFIPAFAAQLGRAGYTLIVYEISEEDLLAGRLPAQINLEQTAAILCIELFDRAYIARLESLEVPILLVDGYSGIMRAQIGCDRITMENLAGITALTEHVISQGARRIGFVGDPEHCSSFRERWVGFCDTLAAAGLTAERELCILDRDDSPYGDPDWLAGRIARMPQLPDALICVNDYIALHVMAALKKLGIAIPDRIMVTGFDGTAQSAVVAPALTTVRIPGADIGRIGADLLLTRIANRTRPPISVYVKTEPVFRETTNRQG